MEQTRCRYGDSWHGLQRQMIRTRQEYSAKGYCTAVPTVARHVAAVAIPIRVPGSADVLVLGCAMSTQHYYRERVESAIAPRMLGVAQRLRDSLSGLSPSRRPDTI